MNDHLLNRPFVTELSSTRLGGHSISSIVNVGRCIITVFYAIVQ